jgi:GNAT superfamily N-acetyltransferase
VSSDRSTPTPRWPDVSWVTYATGRRVSVRRRAGGTGPSGGPALRDVVGVLELASSHAWTVRDRTGERTSFDPAEVVSAIVVPDLPARLRTAADVEVGALEVIAADGWQPLEREPLGSWTLRAANGFTGRANSVLPVGDPGTDLDTALETVKAWYTTRSLTPMFQVPLPLRDDLHIELDDRGWDHHNPTHVMVCDLAPLVMATEAVVGDDLTCAVGETPDKEWLQAFRYRGMPLRPDVEPILTRNEHPVFVSIRGPGGEVRAVGRGALTGRWLGVTAVEVAEPFRRQGLGQRVVGELARHASRRQARHVYLQVAHGNDPAIALYGTLGFVRHHDYVYRRWLSG